jgi:ABC-type oligopeptide transport system substrate-binding subunit
MRKLVIAIGCLTTILLMSSCTADSVESSNNETLKTQNQVTSPANQSAIDGVNPPRPSTESAIDGVNPPRP